MLQHPMQLYTQPCTKPAPCPLQETRAFAEAQTLDQHKALIHIFFAQRSTKRVSGVTDAGLKPRPIKRVAVLGGGLMGSGIATASILAGIDVLLKEINEKFLEVRLTRALILGSGLMELSSCTAGPPLVRGKYLRGCMSVQGSGGPCCALTSPGTILIHQ